MAYKVYVQVSMVGVVSNRVEIHSWVRQANWRNVAGASPVV